MISYNEQIKKAQVPLMRVDCFLKDAYLISIVQILVLEFTASCSRCIKTILFCLKNKVILSSLRNVEISFSFIYEHGMNWISFSLSEPEKGISDVTRIKSNSFLFKYPCESRSVCTSYSVSLSPGK